MWFMRSPKGYGPDPRISLTLNPGYDSAIPDERGRQMGVLIDGQWRDEELPQERGQGGDFRRADSRFRDRITADGSSGFRGAGGGPLSSLRRPRLSLGASHAHLPRAQKSRRRDLGRIRRSRPQG